MTPKTHQRYSDRTCKIIDRGGFIVIKAGRWYLSHWSALAGGEDHFHWACREHALTFGDLGIAFAILSVVQNRDAKVVTFFPRGRVDAEEG